MTVEHNTGQDAQVMPAAPCLAKVVGFLDTTYMGGLQVQLLKDVGDSESASQVLPVRMISPFFGSTGPQFVTGTNTYDDAQKAYGMWMVPPDVGTIVAVIFINGDPGQGFWFGCVPNDFMNFMVPGLAATELSTESFSEKTDMAGRTGRVPVAEYNKRANVPTGNTTQTPKAKHPLATILDNQGLLLDDIRGITTSSARRELPSQVFGISTPGPLDKNGPSGTVGTAEYAATASVSRLGGTTFVMDDGDDKFLRRSPAGDTVDTQGRTVAGSAPYYASVEAGETDGNPGIPHNELVRIRTRTGHQILLHNSEDLIYIGNGKGTTWIELTSNGKIDIYAKDSISVHTENDMNFYAGRDINMEAVRNINVKATGNHQTEVVGNKTVLVTGNNKISVGGTKDESVVGTSHLSFQHDLSILVNGGTQLTTALAFDLKTKGNNNFTSGATTNILSTLNHVETAAKIYMNSSVAAASAGSAVQATLPSALPTFRNPLPLSGASITSIMLRVPTMEPYPHHENLMPPSFNPISTDIVANAPPAIPVKNSGKVVAAVIPTQLSQSFVGIAIPELWKNYTTKTDTFNPPPPPQAQP